MFSEVINKTTCFVIMDKVSITTKICFGCYTYLIHYNKTTCFVNYLTKHYYVYNHTYMVPVTHMEFGSNLKLTSLKMFCCKLDCISSTFNI